jgi:hypothetical protein
MMDEKLSLQWALQRGRDSVVWKLAGLSPYHARRPLVPTGTNLAGLVKHLIANEYGYFGVVFGRPLANPPTWMGQDAGPNDDLFLTADESVDQILGLYREAWTHADATIEALGLDSVGRVPWWPEPYQDVTLHHILVHMVAETARHAGHADILREQVDGLAGLRSDNPNLPNLTRTEWAEHAARLERIAGTAVS